MSEFTRHREQRVKGLQEVFFRILSKEGLRDLSSDYGELIDKIVPADIIDVVHELVEQEIPLEDLKPGINKLINLVSSSILSKPYELPKEGSFLDAMIQSSREMEIRLRKIRPLLKKMNASPSDVVRENLCALYKDLALFEQHYSIVENIIFPVLEQDWKNFKCVKVMWSFHDTIRSNIKTVIQLLSSSEPDLKQLNRLSGDISFNMFAMKFRTERLLFPEMELSIEKDRLNEMLNESIKLGFPYTQPEPVLNKTPDRKGAKEEIDLKTGFMSVEQVRLVFNHLPVDITYVDENDVVKFYSTPKKRIFPRTNAIIGRQVKNCHPPESVHVVEEIVDAFRKGEKEVASFWIQMKGNFILIQYFAIRNNEGEYKGVVEVSQEINEIRKLKGERRLLDWN